MISSKERRRAVAELREASTGAYRHVDALDVIASSVGVEVAGKFSHEVENETYAALADLIDRPSHECTMVYRPERSGDEIYPTESYQCSNCEGVINEGITEYCPWCGYKVSNYETEPEHDYR